MEFERYDIHGNKKHLQRKKFLNKKTIIFCSFLFVIGVILITAFYGNLFLTGKSISSINFDNSVFIFSELSVPTMQMEGDYEKITILGVSKSPLFIGEQKSSLSETHLNEIVLNGFSGKISFDEDKISFLEGRVSEVVLNGVPKSDRRGRKLDVYIDSEIDYNSINFGSDVYIRRLSYLASGVIHLGQKLEENESTRYDDKIVEKLDDKINVIEKELTITHFLGEMVVKNKEMFLEGLVDKVEIKDSRSKIIISS